MRTAVLAALLAALPAALLILVALPAPPAAAQGAGMPYYDGPQPAPADPEYSAGHDAHHDGFYRNLAKPDGGSCCSGADCHPMRQEDVRWVDGRLELFTHAWPKVWPGGSRPPEPDPGSWKAVDPDQILPVPSPDGAVHACTSPWDGGIYCVTLPGNV